METIDSGPFDVCDHPAIIEVIHQPTRLQVNGSVFAQRGAMAFSVRVRDMAGVPVHAVGSVPAMAPVTVKLSHDPGCPAHCASLSGTTSKPIGRNGVVLFDDLIVTPTAPTPAGYMNEAQEISLRMPSTPADGPAATDTFQLSLDFGRGQLFTTTPISANAIATQSDEIFNPNHLGLSMQSKLQALPGVGAVNVRKEAHTLGKGWSWIVTFLSASPMPLLRVVRHLHKANGTLVETRRIKAGQAYAFKVDYNGTITAVTTHFRIE